MTLSVFGVGFGRTGTESLKQALEILGVGPCYHMFEVLPHEERVDEWIRLVQGKTPDWDEIFTEYNSSVDWPGAYFWREIAEHYEEAKLILTLRDAEDWYKSMSKTILPLLKTSSKDPNSLANQMFIERTFDGNIDDKDHVINVFNKHNEAVISSFDPERLLVFELGSGWEPLCAFLDVDLPDQPYPWGNSSDEFDDNIKNTQSARTTVAA